VIVVCTVIFAMVPFILRKTGALGFVGHLVVGTMAAGFTQLTLIEGGVHCHAVAWLASVPLCALLILGVRPALVWAGVCFVVGSVIGLAALNGVELVPFYDPKWHTLIDAAGNLGIIVFLFVLGLVFETSRATAFRQMEASLGELATSNDELTHLNNEKTEFLGIAAHDLRNPLSVVIGAADLITMQSSERASESARLIARSGRRMLELVEDLLDANAIESGHYAERIEPHDLRALVVESVNHHQNGAQRKRIAIEIAAGLPAWAQIDRRAGQQVLDNLISNAVKYSPWDRNVRIDLRRIDDWVEVAISDRGPGISTEDQEKLFRKHTRLSARPTGGESSFGLGLSIVKRLAEAMGGSVRCESQPGSGSTFVFRAKAALNESSAAAVLSNPSADHHGMMACE
jgi:signal transduction histidine kinase